VRTAALRRSPHRRTLDRVISIEECDEAPPVFDLRSDAGIGAAYRAYGAGLHALARRVLDDRGLAEEAVQETFVRAWRSAHTFDADVGSQRGWLYAICRNTSVDLYRHRRIRPVVAEIPTDDRDREAVDELDRAMREWMLEEALRRLAPEHRFVLVGAHIEGRSYDDLAGEIGVPVGTVKSRVFYGLRALRNILTAMGWDDS
jgi:RNA polymerase sigma-70 factor (ECF subfamily)